MTTSLVCLLFFGFVCLAVSDCGPWVPIDIDTLPPAAPGDSIDVYYIVAPLMECQYNNDFAYIGAYHGGLAMINLNDRSAITLNFDAVPSFAQALVPTIINYPNGSHGLQWSNTGGVFIYKGLNESYWDENVQLMTTIDGNIYNNFTKWVKNFNSTNPWYDIWEVLTGWPGSILLPNHECFSFAWESLAYLKSLGAVIGPAEAKVSILALYSDQVPKLVDMTNPENQKAVTKIFYGNE